eukprot:gene10947-8199_t
MVEFLLFNVVAEEENEDIYDSYPMCTEVVVFSSLFMFVVMKQ